MKAKRRILTFADRIRKTLSAKAPARCPIKGRSPSNAIVYDVPKRLRALLCLHNALSDCARNAAKAPGLKGWHSSQRADAVETVLVDSIRAFGRHGLSVHLDFYRDWKYAVTKI